MEIVTNYGCMLYLLLTTCSCSSHAVLSTVLKRFHGDCDQLRVHALQVKLLESLLIFLKDYFYGDGAGIPMARLDTTATRAERLFQLFAAPTEALKAHWEVLLADNTARRQVQSAPEQNVLDPTPPTLHPGHGGGEATAGARRAADVTQVCFFVVFCREQTNSVAPLVIAALRVLFQGYSPRNLGTQNPENASH